jgi:protein required for attachment to host cells
MRNVRRGKFAGQLKPEISCFSISAVLAEDIVSRSNGASRRWESHSKVIYRSSQLHREELGLGAASALLIAESTNSMFLVSAFKNLTITFSPRILQNM